MRKFIEKMIDLWFFKGEIAKMKASLVKANIQRMKNEDTIEEISNALINADRMRRELTDELNAAKQANLPL